MFPRTKTSHPASPRHRLRRRTARLCWNRRSRLTGVDGERIGTRRSLDAIHYVPVFSGCLTRVAPFLGDLRGKPKKSPIQQDRQRKTDRSEPARHHDLIRSSGIVENHSEIWSNELCWIGLQFRSNEDLKNASTGSKINSSVICAVRNPMSSNPRTLR